MNKNKLFLIISVAAVLLMMIGFDMYKTYKEEKPPFPEIFIGSEKFEAYLGPFTWNAGPMNEIKEADLLRDKDNYIVNPIEDLFVAFPEKKPSNIEVIF